MAKIKLTKNELKVQRDSLKRFQRYLPTLQLKKQQLQLEVRQLREKMAMVQQQIVELEKGWSGVLPLLSGTDSKGTADLISVKEWRVGFRNVAGIDVPVFDSITFNPPEYDLYEAPAWYDDIVSMAQQRIELVLKRELMDEMQNLLEQELRVVTQRVNLFEKVKIPEAKDNIRKINIYIGDQQTNSVGRSKIAKGKCSQRNAATESQEVVAD